MGKNEKSRRLVQGVKHKWEEFQKEKKEKKRGEYSTY